MAGQRDRVAWGVKDLTTVYPSGGGSPICTAPRNPAVDKYVGQSSAQPCTASATHRCEVLAPTSPFSSYLPIGITSRCNDTPCLEGAPQSLSFKEPSVMTL